MTPTLKQLLNAYWLRPETALWREIDINAMATFRVVSPSLDLGCGDGIFSFIRAGGEFCTKFDAFQSVSNLDKFFDNTDVFDSFNGSLDIEITRTPQYSFDVGLDFKERLLNKASALGLYSELKQGNANDKLPFENESFNTIFSNIVYWLNSPKDVIVEISRILKPGGRVCLMLPNDTLPNYSFYMKHYVSNGYDSRWSFLELLDRGRFLDNIKHAKSYEEWTKIFASAGLKVDRHQYHLSKLTILTWDIGLRPLFPLLMEMIDLIPKNKIEKIKIQWIDTFEKFIIPLIKLDEEGSGEAVPAFHCFELIKI